MSDSRRPPGADGVRLRRRRPRQGWHRDAVRRRRTESAKVEWRPPCPWSSPATKPPTSAATPGTGVSPDYPTGDNAFTGRIHWVQIDVDDERRRRRPPHHPGGTTSRRHGAANRRGSARTDSGAATLTTRLAQPSTLDLGESSIGPAGGPGARSSAVGRGRWCVRLVRSQAFRRAGGQRSCTSRSARSYGWRRRQRHRCVPTSHLGLRSPSRHHHLERLGDANRSALSRSIGAASGPSATFAFEDRVFVGEVELQCVAGDDGVEVGHW